MIAQLLLAGLVLASGYVCRYDPGTMERVAALRGLSLDGCRGAVALRDCRRLGQRVYLRWPDGQVDGPYRVVDCLDTWNGHVPYGHDWWAVDVDYETWCAHFAPDGAPQRGVVVILPPWAPGWSGILK